MGRVGDGGRAAGNCSFIVFGNREKLGRTRDTMVTLGDMVSVLYSNTSLSSIALDHFSMILVVMVPTMGPRGSSRITAVEGGGAGRYGGGYTRERRSHFSIFVFSFSLLIRWLEGKIYALCYS